MDKDPPKKKHRSGKWLGLLVLLVIIYVLWVTTRALPAIKPKSADRSFSASAVTSGLSWPTYGQSAVSLNNMALLAYSGSQTPAPMASTAKLITALCVLAKKPLAPGQQGPMISLSASDVAIYNDYVAEGGSVVAVVAGEQISEYQMLEAMLLPSADNIADSLADWAFGSLANYTAYANNYLKTTDLANTKVGADASGLDPSSTTTASNLVRIGQLVMSSPVLAQIVGESKADNIPVVGTTHNVNSLLGQENINGIKTGNTSQAGGVFLSSSKITVDNQPVIINTAIMGAPSLWQALHSSAILVASAQANFATPAAVTAIKKDTVVGDYLLPWDNHLIPAYASSDTINETWGGSKVSTVVSLGPISFDDRSGQTVGSINTKNSLLNYATDKPVVLKSAVPRPSNWWLIFHPNYVL